MNNSLKIALIGYGKMGKTIERIAQERNHQITARIDIDNQAEWNSVIADVAIEFSHPDAAFENIKKGLALGIPVISGTTGWLDKKKEIETFTETHNGTFFYASNYSLGVNLFFKINEYAAALLQRFPEYKISMEEIHHTEKKDKPSGTAITLAEGIMKHQTRFKSWTLAQEANDTKLSIQSLREGQVAGIHSVKYNSMMDAIELKHTAHSREGFALGALLVAEWIPGKKGILGMDDFLKI